MNLLLFRCLLLLGQHPVSGKNLSGDSSTSTQKPMVLYAGISSDNNVTSLSLGGPTEGRPLLCLSWFLPCGP